MAFVPLRTTTTWRPALALAALVGLAASAPHGAHAADGPATAAPSGTEQVIEPRVARQEFVLPRFPSRDFEVGWSVGTYATQNFGAHTASSLHLAYHITEDFFVEAAVGASKVSDAQYRQILPGGGIFANGSSTLVYYHMSAGVNLLPGEVFVGRNRALLTSFYLAGGVGNTRFNDQQQQTFHLGAGMRVMLNNRWVIRMDMRDHMFPLDLLGQRQNTHNLELTTGASFVF